MSKIKCPKCGELVDGVDSDDPEDFEIGGKPIADSDGNVVSVVPYEVATMEMVPCGCTMFQVRDRDRFEWQDEQ